MINPKSKKMSTPLVLSQNDIEAGESKDEFTNHGIEEDFMYNNNVHSANTSIRLGNFNKNYAKRYFFFYSKKIREKSDFKKKNLDYKF